MKFDTTKPLWKQKLESEVARKLVPERMPPGAVVTMRDSTSYQKLANGQLVKVRKVKK